jgi:hypothetical protein
MLDTVLLWLYQEKAKGFDTLNIREILSPIAYISVF